jgi:hypothetical protein
MPDAIQIAQQAAFLINASLNQPPSGKVWTPPIFAPDSALEVYEEVAGGARKVGDSVKVVFVYDKDGVPVVRENHYRIYSMSGLQSSLLYQKIMDIWGASFPWANRIGLPAVTYETETSVEGYQGGGSALEMAIAEGRHSDFGSSSVESGFNLLPWLLGGLGYAVAGIVGVPAGFAIGQQLSSPRKPQPSPAN